MELNLDNKKVLITGASRGIGLSIAEGFLNENARTCIVSRGSDNLYKNEKKLQDMYGSENLFATSCDCTNLNSLNILKHKIEEKWDSLDIVIVNVGDGRSSSDPLPNNDIWTKTWDNNFESALNTSRVFLPMLEASKGCLLFISSIAGIESIGAPTDYSTAKAAIIALSKNLSKKLAPNVRVNVIAPGNVYFEGGSWDEKIQKDKNKIQKLVKSSVPMNRFATTDEIADSAVFLCSDRASFITGSVLVIDGGQTSGFC
jgi:3-oxoacyl-[acyl-carrier protein] reductase